MTVKLLTFPLFGVAALAINWAKLVKSMIEITYSAATFIYTYFF
jgi:hypothetical protein